MHFETGRDTIHHSGPPSLSVTGSASSMGRNGSYFHCLGTFSSRSASKFPSILFEIQLYALEDSGTVPGITAPSYTVVSLVNQTDSSAIAASEISEL